MYYNFVLTQITSLLRFKRWMRVEVVKLNATDWVILVYLLVAAWALKENLQYSQVFIKLSLFNLQESPQAARVKVLASGNATERRFR